MPDLPIISIIDDDAAVLFAIDSLVRSLGYITFTFSSAEEFLASSRLEEFDCLITDVRLGGMSGVALQDRLRASGSRLPIIFVTAFSEDHIRARAEEAGATGFFAKPFVVRDMIQCIELALRSS
jgi:FixJ family two-component response regulator